MSESKVLSGSLLREVARLYTRAQRVAADCCRTTNSRTTNTQCHLLTELARIGPLALLRSVAVAPTLHRRGIARMLVSRLLEESTLRQTAKLCLLTVTASEYFARFGFKRESIDQVPPAVKASAEFQGACPACAAFMSLPPLVLEESKKVKVDRGV